MRTLYLRKDDNNLTRKVLIDMAYLVAHKKIRLPKIYFEDSLYVPYFKDKEKQNICKYFLTKDELLAEDNDFYYFKFPFKSAQVEDAAV
ncbi:MAG: hypothetical protein P4L45_00170 [Ignavibacteriaceae bacterium]|nr:hypothetical protein [Ignavibacteriaceae bacterium]